MVAEVKYKEIEGEGVLMQLLVKTEVMGKEANAPMKFSQFKGSWELGNQIVRKKPGKAKQYRKYGEGIKSLEIFLKAAAFSSGGGCEISEKKPPGYPW